jgi:hypothetical protein
LRKKSFSDQATRLRSGFASSRTIFCFNNMSLETVLYLHRSCSVYSFARAWFLG